MFNKLKQILGTLIITSVVFLFTTGSILAATLTLTSVGGTAVSALVNVSTTDSTPTLIGTASPEATVDVSIDDLTVAVLADANGNWSYTPITALADGSHVLTVASNLETLNYVIVVNSGTATTESTSSTTTTTITTDATTFLGVGGATESSSTTLPVSGGVENTLIMFVGGIFLMGLGLVSQQLMPAIQEQQEINLENTTDNELVD